MHDPETCPFRNRLLRARYEAAMARQKDRLRVALEGGDALAAAAILREEPILEQTFGHVLTEGREVLEGLWGEEAVGCALEALRLLGVAL